MIYVEEAGRDTLDRAIKVLAGIEGGVSKAVTSAMKRAESKLRTEAKKAITEKYDISAEAIRANENVNVKYDYSSGVTALISFHGNKIPLHKYGGVSPKGLQRDTSKLVAALIGGRWARVHPGIVASGHQLKGTAPTKFGNAFVAQMKSGHVGIFERTGGVAAGGGDAIKEIMGSSVPQMLGGEDVVEKLTDEAMQTFDERLDHEVSRLLSGIGG